MTTPTPRASGPARLRRLREAGGAAGPDVVYASPFVWTIDGDALPDVTPTNRGGAITSYAIASGALPSGLSLDGTTGAITGTLDGVPASGFVVLTIVGAGGGSTVRLDWETVYDPPSIEYANAPFSWPEDVEIDEETPTNSGGPATFAVVAGTLPTGIVLDADTGELSGTPTTVHSAVSVTIRATNAWGTSDAVVSMTVTA